MHPDLQSLTLPLVMDAIHAPAHLQHGFDEDLNSTGLQSCLEF
jgi:hypothetical protein